MSPDPDRCSIGDPARNAVLDVERGYVAVWGVRPDGSPDAWVARAGDAPDDGTGCHCRNCAPHEQLGALPERYRPVARCRRPRRDGKPCRTPVARPGAACANHRDREGTA